jgi:hypothetical protein
MSCSDGDSRLVRLSTSALAGDLDLYPWVFQMKFPYLDLCRYQPPGDSDSQVKYLHTGRSWQVLMTDPGQNKYLLVLMGIHNLQIWVVQVLTCNRSQWVIQVLLMHNRSQWVIQVLILCIAYYLLHTI